MTEKQTRKPRVDKGKKHVVGSDAANAAAVGPAAGGMVQGRDATPEPPPEAPGRAAQIGPSLGALELAAIVQEAWEAYDMQDTRVRFDTQGFKWWFGVVTDTGESELKLMRSSPVGDFHAKFISTRDLGRDCARQLVEDAVRGMA